MAGEIIPPQRASRGGEQDKLRRARRRRRRRRQRMLVLAAISLVAIFAFAWAERERRQTAARLRETQQQLEQINTSTEEQAAAEAQDVLQRAGRLFDLPKDPPPTVATIVNVEQLRATSAFYNKAEDGDQLIITADRAILYDPDRDIILDVVSIELPASPAEASGEGAAQQKNEQPEAAAPDGAELTPAAPPPPARTP